MGLEDPLPYRPLRPDAKSGQVDPQKSQVDPRKSKKSQVEPKARYKGYSKVVTHTARMKVLSDLP